VSAFVGRARELDRLERLLDQPAQRIALIHGEAGVGKSRLVRELAARASARGAAVRLGRFVESDGAPPFAGWIEALGGLPAAGGLGSAAEAARVGEAVAAALATAAPVLLVLEDLHWADRDSLRLLRHVVRAAPPAWIVGTVRDPDVDAGRNEALDELGAELRRDDAAEVIALKPFAEDELGALLEAEGGRPVPQAIVRAMLGETAGNAFYAREVFRHLIDEGLLIDRPQGWTADRALVELGLPPGVRQVVRRRAARLGDATRALLQVAAALGGEPGFDVLAEVAGLGDADAVAAVDEALAAGLLRPARPGAYGFVHAIVQRALLEELSPERRARLHRRIAEALAARRGGDVAGAIAAQYLASRALPGASAGVAFARAAAIQARAAAAFDRAASAWETACALGAGEPGLGELLGERAVAEAEALRLDAAAVTAADACDRLLSEGAAPAAVASILERVARELRAGGGARPGWEPLVHRGLALIGEARDRTWARLRLLAEEFVPVMAGPVFVSRLAPFDPDAVAILRATGDEDDFALTVDAHHGRTLDETEAILRAIRGWSRPAAILRAGDACVRDLFFLHDRYREVIDRGDELRAIAERAGAVPAQVSALAVLGNARVVLGEIEAARTAAARAAELASRLGALTRMHRIAPTANAVTIGYLVGCDWLDVIAEVRRFAHDPAAARTPWGLVAINLATLGTAMGGAVDDALTMIDAVATILSRAPASMVERGTGRDCAATALWHLVVDHSRAIDARVTEPARALLAICARDAAEIPDASAPVSCRELTEARMRVLLGEPAGAAFEAARERFARDGRVPLAAIVDHDEAWAGRKELIDRAATAFDRLDLGPWRERVAWLRGQPAPAPAGLSPREAEVLGLLARGLANKEIGARLFISVATVERHVANIYAKIGTRGRAAATAYALKHGLA